MITFWNGTKACRISKQALANRLINFDNREPDKMLLIWERIAQMMADNEEIGERTEEMFRMKD